MAQENWDGPPAPGARFPTIGRRLVSDLRAALGAPTSRHAGLVLTGNALAGAIGFVVAIILSRQLGPVAFGILTTAAATAITVSGLMDFGLSVGLVRFAALYLASEPGRVDGMLSTALVTRAAGSLVLLVLGWMASPILAGLLFHEVAYWWVMALAVLGGVVLSGIAHVNAVLQAYQRFALVGLLPLVATTARMLLVVAIVFGPLFTLSSTLAAFLLAPAIALLLGGFLVPRSSLWPVATDHRRNLAELSVFIKWLSLGFVVNALFSRVDVLLLSSMRDSQTVGIYGVAYQLTLPVTMTIGAAAAALTPKVSCYTSRVQYLRYAGHIVRLGLLWVVAGTALSFPLVPLVGVIFGPAYAEAGGIFQILLVGWLIATPLCLIGLLATAMNLPQLLAVTTSAQSVVTAVGNFALIPWLGAYGPAFTFLAAVILCQGSVAVFIIQRARRMPLEPMGEAG
ncbi:MAG: oligosaccharide flippase family protein [Bacteroidetes bacterium]|nr:oligosaccharide flippase family protein [Bacteroidota bacterium]MCL5026453.1 oligosaccharide flippase family protein [Chloroflexota bacterium]